MEHDEQAALFQWAGYNLVDYPELALLFAIPNGGDRHPVVAAKLQAEGVKAGVPDTCLPCARGRFHGLYLEMKFGNNLPTKEQRKWLENLKAQGYFCCVAWDWLQAKQFLIWYLEGAKE